MKKKIYIMIVPEKYRFNINFAAILHAKVLMPDSKIRDTLKTASDFFLGTIILLNIELSNIEKISFVKSV